MTGDLRRNGVYERDIRTAVGVLLLQIPLTPQFLTGLHVHGPTLDSLR